MGRRVRFGIVIHQNQPWSILVERWQLFERLGFDSLWVGDHFVQPSRPTGPYYEAWTLLAALATRTERVRVGVLVSSTTFRHPALLAKQAVTVDHLSGGRLELGLGAGWYEPEHRMFGLEFPTPAELVGRFREAVEVVDGLLRNETFSYAGRYYELHDARCRPGPLQQPRPPLVMAAHKRRMLQIVARYADAWNSLGTVDELRERGALLEQECAAIGRDTRSIVHSLYGSPATASHDPWDSVEAFRDMVGRYREAGVDEFLFDQPRPDQQHVLELVAADVMPTLCFA